VSAAAFIVVVMTKQLTDNGGPTAVEVRGLVKHYGETKALDGVDLDVRQGTVLGVLGPNGAGKTTLVRVLSTLILPDAGTARVAGYDVLTQPRQLRRVIGLTGQYASVDEKLSGWENLYMIGRLLDLPRARARARADELLERFSLTEAAKRPATQYSGGMRRRLDLAASMIGRPAVLYLDEPTTGLDPRTRNEVWEEVRRMVDEGSTVLLTTQYMEEAEHLADEVAVIDRGRVIASGQVAELKTRVGGRTLVIRPSESALVPAMAEAIREAGLDGVAGAHADLAEGAVSVPILSDEQLTAVVGLVGARGFGIASIGTHLPSLDEVFLSITGQKPDGDGSSDTAGTSVGNDNKSHIYKTTDAGKSWSTQYSDPRSAFFLDGLVCRSEKICFAISDPIDGKFPILHTEDGELWSELPAKSLPSALPTEGLFAASNSSLFLCGPSQNDILFATGGPAARVFHSSDDAHTWTVATTPILSGNPAAGIFSIACDGQTVVAVGGDYRNPTTTKSVAAYSHDLGATWHLADQAPAGYRSAVSAVPSRISTTWVAVGTTGTDVSSDNGAHWTPLTHENANAVLALAQHLAITAGPKGTITQLNIP